MVDKSIMAFIGGNIPQALYDKLANDAVESKRSISKQIEFILEQYFKQKKKGETKWLNKN